MKFGNLRLDKEMDLSSFLLKV